MEKSPVQATAVARIVIWAIVAALLIGLFATLMLGDYAINNLFHFNLGSYSYSDPDSYQAGAGKTRDSFTKLDISWVSGEVHIIPTSGSETRIEEDLPLSADEDEALRWKIENGTLTVKFSAPSGLFGMAGSDHAKTLSLYVPEKLLENFEDLHIDSVSAVVNIDSFRANEIHIESVSGAVSAAEIEAKKFSAESVSGKITLAAAADEASVSSVSGDITLSGEIRNIDAETTSGEISLALGTKANKVDLETTSGKMLVTLSDENQGIVAEFDSVSGDFESELAFKSSGDKHTLGSGSVQLDAESVSGDLIISAR